MKDVFEKVIKSKFGSNIGSRRRPMERNWKILANRSKHPNGIDRGLIYPVLIRKVIPKLFFWRKTCCITEISCSIKRTLMIVEEIITIPLVEKQDTTRHKTQLHYYRWGIFSACHCLKQCFWMCWGFMTTELNNGEIFANLISYRFWQPKSTDQRTAWGTWMEQVISKVIWISFYDISCKSLLFFHRSKVNHDNICLLCETS